jgi:hypothetical protein
MAAIITRDPSATRFHACERFDRCSAVPSVGVHAQTESASASREVEVEDGVVCVNPVSMSAAQASAYFTTTEADIRMAEGKLPPTLLVPLSRHSTLPELRALVKLFRPKTVVPNTTEPKLGGLDGIAMRELFEGCLCDSASAGKKEREEGEGQGRMSGDTKGAKMSRNTTAAEYWAAGTGAKGRQYGRGVISRPKSTAGAGAGFEFGIDMEALEDIRVATSFASGGHGDAGEGGGSGGNGRGRANPETENALGVHAKALATRWSSTGSGLEGKSGSGAGAEKGLLGKVRFLMPFLPEAVRESVRAVVLGERAGPTSSGSMSLARIKMLATSTNLGTSKDHLGPGAKALFAPHPHLHKSTSTSAISGVSEPSSSSAAQPLHQHQHHPYPDEADEQLLAQLSAFYGPQDGEEEPEPEPGAEPETQDVDAQEQQARTMHELFASQAGVDRRATRWWAEEDEDENKDGNGVGQGDVPTRGREWEVVGRLPSREDRPRHEHGRGLEGVKATSKSKSKIETKKADAVLDSSDGVEVLNTQQWRSSLTLVGSSAMKRTKTIGAGSASFASTVVPGAAGSTATVVTNATTLAKESSRGRSTTMITSTSKAKTKRPLLPISQRRQHFDDGDGARTDAGTSKSQAIDILSSSPMANPTPLKRHGRSTTQSSPSSHAKLERLKIPTDVPDEDNGDDMHVGLPSPISNARKRPLELEPLDLFGHEPSSTAVPSSTPPLPTSRRSSRLPSKKPATSPGKAGAPPPPEQKEPPVPHLDLMALSKLSASASVSNIRRSSFHRKSMASSSLIRIAPRSPSARQSESERRKHALASASASESTHIVAPTKRAKTIVHDGRWSSSLTVKTAHSRESTRTSTAKRKRDPDEWPHVEHTSKSRTRSPVRTATLVDFDSERVTRTHQAATSSAPAPRSSPPHSKASTTPQTPPLFTASSRRLAAAASYKSSTSSDLLGPSPSSAPSANLIHRLTIMPPDLVPGSAAALNYERQIMELDKIRRGIHQPTHSHALLSLVPGHEETGDEQGSTLKLRPGVPADGSDIKSRDVFPVHPPRPVRPYDSTQDALSLPDPRDPTRVAAIGEEVRRQVERGQRIDFGGLRCTASQSQSQIQPVEEIVTVFMVEGQKEVFEGGWRSGSVEL